MHSGRCIVALLLCACLSTGFAFSLSGVGAPSFRKSFAELPLASLSSPPSLFAARVPVRTGTLSLKSSGALAVEPAAAWKKSNDGDFADLSNIIKNAEVLRASDGSKVRIGDVVEGKKALVCFMRHTG